jgi:hypothetical protein
MHVRRIHRVRTSVDLMAEESRCPADLTAEELAEIAYSVYTINLEDSGEIDRPELTDGGSDGK